MKAFLSIIIVFFLYLTAFDLLDLIDHPDTLSIWLISGSVLFILTALLCLIKHNIIYAIGISALGALMQVAFLSFMPNYNFSIAETSSNAPSIKPNDLVVARAFYGKYNRGQMVSFFEKNGRFSRKRIHGIPGDKILVCNATVYVNNYHYSVSNDWQPVEFDYSERCSSRSSTYLLGEDELFVLGDNSNNSLDSRYYGPIKSSQIKFLELYSADEDSPWIGKAKVTFLQKNFKTP